MKPLHDLHFATKPLELLLPFKVPLALELITLNFAGHVRTTGEAMAFAFFFYISRNKILLIEKDIAKYTGRSIHQICLNTTKNGIGHFSWIPSIIIIKFLNIRQFAVQKQSLYTFNLPNFQLHFK